MAAVSWAHYKSLRKKTFFCQPLLQACDVGNVAGLTPQTLCCHALICYDQKDAK